MPDRFDKTAEKMKKRWNFIPFSYSPPHGLIDLIQIFSTPYLTLQLHRINFPDPFGYYHDHPWSFISMIVKGGYDEYLWTDPYSVNDYTVKKRPLGSIHFLSNKTSHRIYRCKPKTWTLFVCGPWKRNGFRFYKDGEDFDISSMVETSSSGKNVINMR